MSAQDHNIFTGILSGYVALNREGRVTIMDRVAHDLLAQVGCGLGRCWQEVFPPNTAVGRALGQVWQSGQPALLSAPAHSGSGRLFTRVAPTPDGAEVHLELCEVEPGPWDPGQNTARLLQLTQELNAAPGLDAMVETFIRHLHQEAYGVLLALHDPARDCLEVRYAVDYDEAILAPFLQVPLQMQCPATEVFHSGELLILSREECLARYTDLPLAEGTQELVVVPLQASRGVIGVLLLSLHERGTLGLPGRSQMMLLCTHMAGAIERTQLADEARRNESRYRTLLESTSAILWETESNFQVVRNMPTWEAFTGQTFREYRGQGYMTAVHPDDRPAVLNAIQEGLRGGGRFAMQGRLMTARGVYRQVVAQAVPVLGEAGEVLSWMGTVQDVTDAYQHQLRETATREVLLKLNRTSSAREVYETTLAEVVQRTGRSAPCWLGCPGTGRPCGYLPPGKSRTNSGTT
ncbi:PAS domain S-box protein [Deinococcus malanensis]|uniref:PAS domain S-box protein n=1 Tax=Deinococcus malanensis TaxID=1706855 RepID=UPI003638CE27